MTDTKPINADRQESDTPVKAMRETEAGGIRNPALSAPDTKPTPRTDAVKAEVEKDKDRLPYVDFLFRMVGDLSNHARELERELAAIRSAELPVEPETTIDDWDNELVLKSDYNKLKAYALNEKERGDQWETTATNLLTRAEKAESELSAIRSAELPVEPESVKANREAVKKYGVSSGIIEYIDALKSYAPKLSWLFTHCKTIGMTAKSDSGKFEDDIALFTIDLKLRAEKAESELAALRARLMEPDDEMIDAGMTIIHNYDAAAVFKAMCAVAMKEGK